MYFCDIKNCQWHIRTKTSNHLACYPVKPKQLKYEVNPKTLERPELSRIVSQKRFITNDNKIMNICSDCEAVMAGT